MSNRKTKNIIEYIVEFEDNFWNRKDFNTAISICKSVFDKNLIIDSPAFGTNSGNETFLNIYSNWHIAFPNMRVEDIKVNATENFVLLEWYSTCVHEGFFNSIPPTKRKVNYCGKAFYQFRSNIITNYTCYIDMTNLYKRLGVSLQLEEYENQSILKNNYKLLMGKLGDLTASLNVKLTLKEMEVLSFWLSGYTLKSIASIFNISPRTVESHIEHINKKFGCRSKCDLSNIIKSKKISYLFRDLYILLSKTKNLSYL